jgi:hypothetical protein
VLHYASDVGVTGWRAYKPLDTVIGAHGITSCLVSRSLTSPRLMTLVKMIMSSLFYIWCVPVVISFKWPYIKGSFLQTSWYWGSLKQYCTLLQVPVRLYGASRKLIRYTAFSTPTVKSEAIPVTSRGGPQGCETSRLPHCLDSLQMAVRLSALRAGRALPPERSTGTRFC